MFDASNAWVLIPIAAIFAGVVKQGMRGGAGCSSDAGRERLPFGRARRRWEHDREDFDRTADAAAAHAAQTARLEERVRVLERIVTDKGLDVSIEIERLRDNRAN